MNKTISYEEFKNTITNVDIVEVEWNGLSVTSQKRLSLPEMLSFVATVSTSCFSDKGEYRPEIKDFILNCELISRYTNIELPDDTIEKYTMACLATDLIATIKQEIDTDQYYSICRAIDSKIHHVANANIQAITVKMNEITASFDNLEKTLSKTFSGVDSEMIKKLASSASNGRIDEEKLVKAINKEKAAQAAASSTGDNIVKMPQGSE